MSALLSTSEEAALASLMEDELTDTCDVYTVAYVDTDSGREETVTLRSDDEPCSYAFLSGTERAIAEQQGARVDLAVTLRAGLLVRGSDRLTVHDTVTGESFDCEVTHVAKQTREGWRTVYAALYSPEDLDI